MKKLIVALVSVCLWGCGHKTPELDGVIHKDKLPVYTNCEPDPKQALNGAEEFGDDGAFYDKYWEFKTTDKPEQVIEFYKKAWPGAKVEKEDEYTEITYVFPGAEKGELMTARVRPDGSIHLGECLKAGKHKRD